MAGRLPVVLVSLVSLTMPPAAAAISLSTPARSAATSRMAYARAVTRICAHALLFEKSHPIGTRAGALEVAGDIRASTQRRLVLVASLTTPSAQPEAVGRWLALERRLADTYALDYVRINDIIAAPRSPEQDSRVARRLANLVHAPDRLRRAATLLERLLHVPDCTGG